MRSTPRVTLTSTLSRTIGELKKDVKPKAVHRLRTTLRRLEATSEYSKCRVQPKLSKQMAKLRKAAGKVRDMDVQIEALDSLKVSSKIYAEKQQLRRHLLEQRQTRAKKLLKQLGANNFQKLRARLKRTKLGAVPATSAEAPYQNALRLVEQIGTDFSLGSPNALTVENLHELRLRCKQARYTAELAGEHAAAKQLVDALKSVQDAIGEWHDWLELTALAEVVLDEQHGRTLVAALRTLRNSKFRGAVTTSLEVIGSLFLPGKKVPERVRATPSAHAVPA